MFKMICFLNQNAINIHIDASVSAPGAIFVGPAPGAGLRGQPGLLTLQFMAVLRALADRLRCGLRRGFWRGHCQIDVHTDSLLRHTQTEHFLVRHLGISLDVSFVLFSMFDN